MTKTEAEGVKTGTPPTGSAALNPGDEAAPGTMGTGEDVCVRIAMARGGSTARPARRAAAAGP
jgi:hypothetical protein